MPSAKRGEEETGTRKERSSDNRAEAEAASLQTITQNYTARSKHREKETVHPMHFFLFIYSHLRTPRYRTNQYLVDSVLNGGWQTLSSALRMWSQLCGVERCSKWWRALIKQAHSCWNVGRDLKEWIRQVGSIDYSMRNWRVLMIQPQHSFCGNDWKTPTGCKFCQLTTFTLNATLSCWRKRNLVV